MRFPVGNSSIGSFLSEFRAQLAKKVKTKRFYTHSHLWSRSGKNMENHLVDPTEKTENSDLRENVTDKRNQKYITPNTRLTIFVQHCAANTRLTQKLRWLQRRQSEQHRFADFIKFQQISTCPRKWGGNFRRMFRGILRSDETQQELQKSAKFEISRNAVKFRTR